MMKINNNAGMSPFLLGSLLVEIRSPAYSSTLMAPWGTWWL